MTAYLGVDAGESAGFAVVSDGQILTCAQLAPSPKKRAEVWSAHLRGLFARFPIERVGIESPCYSANEGRPHGVSAALGERVGELRGLCWGFGVDVVPLPWRAWQGWAFRGLFGSSEAKCLERARAMGVPMEWLMGPRGGILQDAASACCMAGAMWAGEAGKGVA